MIRHIDMKITLPEEYCTKKSDWSYIERTKYIKRRVISKLHQEITSGDNIYSRVIGRSNTRYCPDSAFHHEVQCTALYQIQWQK